MAKKLTNLRLHELSIVRGQGVQPANPEAVAAFYKTEPGGEEEKGQMDKQSAPATVGDQDMEKSALAKFGGAMLDLVTKATRTVTYKDEGTHTMTETISPDGSPVMMAAETAKAEAKIEKAEPPAPAIDAEGLTKSLGDTLEKGLKPISDKLVDIEQRLTKVEKKPTGSQQPNTETSLTKNISITDNSGSSFPLAAKALRDQLGLTAGQALTKAAITTSDFSVGLTTREATEFLDFVYDQSVLLKQIRRVDMNARTVKIDKIGLGSRVFRKGVEATDPGETVSVSPTEITLVASEIIAIIRVSDDTLEDNIEGDRIVDHILGMVARAGANEIEAAAMHGDTAVADSTGINDRWNGWDKLARADGAHVIEGAATAETNRYWPGTDAAKITKLIKAMPTKYMTDEQKMRFILHPHLFLDYLDELSGTNSGEAFSSITDRTNPAMRGIPTVKMPLFRKDIAFSNPVGGATDDFINGTMVWLTDPRNLIMGIHRDIRIEADRLPRLRATDYVVTMRGDVEVENGDAVAIYDHLLVNGETSLAP